MTVLSVHLPSPSFGVARARVASRVHETSERLEEQGSQRALMVASSSIGLVAVALSALGLTLVR
jgi:hypothetical protein